MASVYRPRGRTIYRIEFKDQHGKTRKIASGTTERRIAESLGMKIEEDAGRLRVGIAPLHPDVTGPYLGLVAMTRGAGTWKEFRRRFEAEYLSGLRPRTREKAGTVLDVFEDELSAGRMQPGRQADRLPMREITAGVISGFAAALRSRPIVKRGKPTGRVGLAPWTIKNYLIALKTALAWAVEQKLLSALPAFPAIKVPKKKPQPIAEVDWQKLYAAAPDDHWRAYLMCGWWGGLRLSEARHLRRLPSEEFPWVDWAVDRIILPAKFAKSDEDQWVPLHPVLREALGRLPQDGDEFFPFRSRRTGGPLTRNGITNYVCFLAKKAGVKLSMHRLRKGFGCRVAQQLGKGRAPILHRLMRHSSMQVTMDFYASVDDTLHDAIRELDAPPQEKKDGQGGTA